ncbi:hypothetical protein GCM10009682_56810 [Luedemannella flava]|uniref:Uncharacterized protein n=1 Tax=Luedemannella flava TaxID=349316 RepID=A0ABP4YWW8_9ACTN
MRTRVLQSSGLAVLMSKSGIPRLYRHGRGHATHLSRTVIGTTRSDVVRRGVK